MIKPFKDPVYVTKPLMPPVKEYSDCLKHIIRSQKYSNNGVYVQLLEKMLRERLNIENNAIFCNGTVALMVGLKALDLQPGTGIITTPFTFPATANVLEWIGLKPVFCDVDYDTINITPETVSGAYQTAISAIMPVHLFGNPCDVDGFEDLVKDSDIKLIYDAAHAFDVKVNKKDVSNYGDISMFSFHPTKLFHTGEGGMLTYKNPELDEKIKQLRNFGIKDDTVGSILPGINGKMNEFQAAMGLFILDQIDEEKEKRKNLIELYKIYLSELDWIKFIEISENVTQNYQYMPIRIIGKSRDEIDIHLKKYNVLARKYFYPICSDFPHFKDLKTNVPNAEKISQEILCLPLYGELKEKDIEKICEIIKEFK